MVEESESYSDIELDMPPKLTFEELRQQVMKDPPMARQRLDLLRTLYYYSKDAKKHSRIIKVLFWALIVPLLQDTKNNQQAYFGLKSLNQLITNEGSHDQIIGMGRSERLLEKPNVQKMVARALQQTEADGTVTKKTLSDEQKKKVNLKIKSHQNPIRILANIVLNTEPSNIMIEATKAIRNLSKTPEVVDMLMEENDLLRIYREKILLIDSQSQENIMMTISAACKDIDYRQRFVEDDDFFTTLLQQIKSVSKNVTLQALRICRQLAKDEQSLEKLQGDNLRLSRELIYAFQWLDALISKQEDEKKRAQIAGAKQPDQNQSAEQAATGNEANPSAQFGAGAGANQEQALEEQQGKQLNDAIYREISKAFEYILKYYDLHKRQIDKLVALNPPTNGEGGEYRNTENQIIETIVQLGRSTRDLKTTLNAATSLSHITEVLQCNEQVATDDVIDFMIDMLKDTKNVKHHRQGCRYFANLSFYKEFRDKLIKKEIATFLLKAIEGRLEEDTIKHAAIALANLSSHKDFMRTNQDNCALGPDTTLSSKAEKWMIKPLIHLLDQAQDHKIDLIQSACITLCNMASKPSLHKHFVHEPEISTFKQCLANPIDKGQGNELSRFMIKLVCNLTKNPEVLPHLLKKGFLEILFDMLNHDREKEIFGNVVTAIAYLSVHQEAQEEIKRNNIIPKILEPLTQIHPVDQKMIIIAITSMLFNGIDLQKEFIKHNGLGKLLFFLQQKEKIYYQLACKCFSLLSESEEILNKIIDQECLNTIIISCLRSTDIDLETLKEITKIFINLILWRKLKPEIIETTCCLCDIGLMIDDLDMNILAMFCLNSLSEDEGNHEKIIQQGNSQLKVDKLSQNKGEGSNAAASVGGLKNKAKNDTSGSQSQQSIFPRINFLLKHCKQSQNDDDMLENSKRELLVTLITSFYLNLARNKVNRDFLLKLELFRSLSELMLHRAPNGLQTLQNNQTALCYTNTIFSKLLKFQDSRINCMKEQGYQLFISILKHDENKHLFLESLDCIKLFLMTRAYLDKFHEVPETLKLDKDCPELNVSFLQVLAILSFEKHNHDSLKKYVLNELDKEGMFDIIFEHFDKIIKEEKSAMELFDHHNPGSKRKIALEQPTEGSEAVSAISHSGIQSAGVANSGSRRNLKSDLNRSRQIELALAISIILSNLSNDEKYIEVLLGVPEWNKRFQEQNGLESFTDGDGALNNSYENQPLPEEFILKQYEVQRITGMFNLLSHPDPFISEQISILLANVSNSQFFYYQFISDRCMKSIIKILRFKSQSTQTEVSLLAILITILNLSAIKEVVKGIENMGFLSSLDLIIWNEAKPLEQRSIALMAISNIFTQSEGCHVSEQTEQFAFNVLKNWKHMRDDQKQNEEVIKNLVYASLILFYNMLLQNFKKTDSRQQSTMLTHQKNRMKELIWCLNTHIMEEFTDHTIVNVVLHLITLFTKSAETANILFNNSKILAYIFGKLREPEKSTAAGDATTSASQPYNEETIKLATLALSRLSSKFDRDQINPNHYMEQLSQFDNFEFMLSYAQKKLSRGQAEVTKPLPSKKATEKRAPAEQSKVVKVELTPTLKDTLKYLFNILENVTSVSELRDRIDCAQLFVAIRNLFNDRLDTCSKKSLINILFNLNFKLQEPHDLNIDFLQLLYKTYQENQEAPGVANQSAIQRKMISIVVVSSALEVNHESIIKSSFYMQFKKNINEDYQTMCNKNEEVELIGLVNIALNKRLMERIYQDLKKIHKIAIKNDKIDFKTKVDLFVEVSKYVAKLSSDRAKRKEEHKDEANLGQAAKNTNEQNEKERGENHKIQSCLQALIYTMVRLTVQLDQSNFIMYKYFLLAILDCTRNLRHHLKYIIQINQILDFLRLVLKQQTSDFNFQVKEFQDNQVLVFSLKMIVCEIFFNMKFEMEFFKLFNISEAIGLLIEFAQQVLQMSIDKKTQLVSNTLRLLSSMITTIHQMENAGDIITQTKAIPFVKQSLQLSRDLQPCVNIDALFCLSNMMNVPQIAESEELCNMETIFNALAIYFAFNEKVALDECLITYLFSISKLPKYQVFLKDKSKVLFKLMDRHLSASSDTQLPSCRQKLFSTFHNLTETKESCLALNVKQFIRVTNQMLKETASNLKKPQSEAKNYPSENIHELAMKTLINLCRHSSEAIFETDLQELLGHIATLYADFSPLAKQYALRLVTILTSEWKPTAMEGFLAEITRILSEFISHCTQSVEVKLVLINLEKIASHKTLMQKLARIDQEEKSLARRETPAKALIKNISQFLVKNYNEADYTDCTDQLLRFCKKMSQQSSLQQALVDEEVQDIALEYLNNSQHSLAACQKEGDDVKLKAHLQTVQNVMKMVKHLFEGIESHETKKKIVSKIEQHRSVMDHQVDSLLQTYKGNEDMIVMIVKIISCFNSISNELDKEKVLDWIAQFSSRMIESAQVQSKKGSQSSYLERYVFIIELLVTKNLATIDRGITETLLQIYTSDTKYFSKTIWYKMLKILAHLLHLQDIMQGAQKIDKVNEMFEFIINAQKHADETLSFLYFMRVTMLLTKKACNDQLFCQSANFKIVLRQIADHFKQHMKEIKDELIMEIILYEIDFFRMLMNHRSLHDFLNKQEFVRHFIEMLDFHTNEKIVKALSVALKEASDSTQFYPDLLSDNALNTVLRKILHPKTQQSSLQPLYECLNSVLIKTKAPIKYLLATSVLRLTESEVFDRSPKEEANVLYILKVLQSNLKSLDTTLGNVESSAIDETGEQESHQVEQYKGLQHKAHKYCLLAMSNILMKTNCDYIFTRKHKLVPLDELIMNDRTCFENDPQMNLRFLTLINIAFKKDSSQSKQSDQQSNEEKKLKELIDNILHNIFKFRNILDSNKSYFFDIPKLTQKPTLEILSASGAPSTYGPGLLKVNTAIGITDAVSEEQQRYHMSTGSQKNIVPPVPNVFQKNNTTLAMSKRNILAVQKDQRDQGSHSNLPGSLLAPKVKSAANKMELAPSASGFNDDSSSQVSASFARTVAQAAGKFFFEEPKFSIDGNQQQKTQPLMKSEAIRLSLCLSVKALYKMTKQRKRYACNPIIDNVLASELFRFFNSYVNYGDGSTREYVIKVLKIFQNCSEVASLCKGLLDMDIVSQLTAVANKILADETLGENTLAIRDSILEPILKTFEQLNQGDIDWHLKKQNMQTTLQTVREKSKNDQIRDTALNLMDAIGMGAEEQDDYSDIQEHIQSITEGDETKQQETLSQLESALRQKTIVPKKIGNYELGMLIQIYQRTLGKLSPTPGQITVMELILKILNLVYEQKLKQSSTSQHEMLFYRNGINQVYNTQKRQITSMMTSDAALPGGASINPNDIKVSSVIELEETFQTLRETITKQRDKKTIVELVLNLLCLYSESPKRLTSVAIEYIFPSIQLIINTIRDSEEAQEISRSKFNQVLDCLLTFLQIKDTKLQILRQFDVAQLLLRLVQRDQVKDDREILKKFEEIVKAVFFQQGVLQASSEQLIKYLLKSPSSHINKLGIQSLNCIALGLHDKATGGANMALFEDDSVISSLVFYVKEKQSMSRGAVGSNQQVLALASDGIVSQTHAFKSTSKLRTVALQVLAMICEFQYAEFVKEKQTDKPGTVAGELTQRVFIGHGLLAVLIHRCLADKNAELPIEEVRLIARAFASLPPEVLVSEQIHIFDQETVNQHEKKLDEQLRKAGQAVPLNRGDGYNKRMPELNFISWLKALAHIVSEYKDPDASYFAFLSVMSFISNVKLLAPVKDGQTTVPKNLQKKGPIDLSEWTLEDLDYQMLSACLMRTHILELALIQPSQPEADSNIMSVCMNLVITLVFKAQRKRILVGKPNEKTGRIPKQMQDLYRRLSIDFSKEKRGHQELLQVFVNKLHQFEIQNIQNQGYVQFIHLISQIVQQTNTPIDCRKERCLILPTQGILRQLIQSWSLSMDETTINTIVNGPGGTQEVEVPAVIKKSKSRKGSPSKGNSVSVAQLKENALVNSYVADSDQMKMLLYKFFFFNYVLQVSGADIMESLTTGESDDPLIPFGENLASVTELPQLNSPPNESQRIEATQKANLTVLVDLINSLILVLQTLRSRRMNAKFDKAVRTGDGVQQDSAQMAHDTNVAAKGEERKNGGGAPVSEEEKRAAEEEDQKSTSLQVVKMTLFNLQTTLKMIEGSDFAIYFDFQLQKSQLQAFESIVTEYEDNGDIIEPVYVIMEMLLALGTPDHPTVMQIDHSKTMLRQAVRHSAVYQCPQAYSFLKQLISSSSRFKNKSQMVEAMVKIAPPGCAPIVVPERSPSQQLRDDSDRDNQLPVAPAADEMAAPQQVQAAQQDVTQPE